MGERVDHRGDDVQRRNTSASSEMSRCSAAVAKRGQPRVWKRALVSRPSTTVALNSSSTTAPAPRVVYQRSVLFMSLRMAPALGADLGAAVRLL